VLLQTFPSVRTECGVSSSGPTSGQATQSAKWVNCIQGGGLMFRTIFLAFVAVWMLGLVLHFGGSVIHLLLVVAAIVLVMNYMLRRHSFN
jgi:uncharacterized protein DUF5670